MANQFIARKGLIVSGSATISGSVTASAFAGNGAGLTNIISSSYATTASYALNGGGGGVSSSYAVTSSYATTAQTLLGSVISAVTASYISGTAWTDGGTFTEFTSSVVSASYATTAGTLLGSVVSASYALTASYALNGGGGGGSWATLTGIPTGLVSSSVQATTWTVTSASYALTASYALNGGSWATLTGIPTGLVSSSVQATSWTVASASVAVSSSYATSAVSASWALVGVSASYATTASYAVSASWAPVGAPVSASYATTASYAVSASWAPAGGSAVAPSRQLAQLNSGIVIGYDQTITGSVAVALGFVLYQVRANQPMRLRLYATTTGRNVDLLRGINVEPTGSHDVILDMVTTSAQTTASLAPFTFGAMLDTPATINIPFSLTNLQTGSVGISSSILYLPLE